MPSDEAAHPEWPELSYAAWRDTYATLHLWLQIVGKVQLQCSPWINHSWHVALQLTARGMATRLIKVGSTTLQIEFDFVDHCLRIRVDDGRERELPLTSQSTAAFYRQVMEALAELGARVDIDTMPNELPDPIPFDVDEVHGSYQPQYVQRYWRVLANTQHVFEKFRARFVGKCSPVHFFWGSADLAVTRFSGRSAPPHPGGVPHLPDWVAREAYSHEVSSAGFWAGGEQYPQAIFYSYAYPEPMAFPQAAVAPRAAHYSPELKEFVLPYQAVRTASSPEAAILDFLQSTYAAAADLGAWNRSELERDADRSGPSSHGRSA